MPAPTVYRWDDASAPVLSGTVSALINLLDACLVNGYGAKSAAGWTKPYTGTDKACFRNSPITGTGYYFRVQDDGSSTGLGRDAIVRGYRTMSDVDTGVDPIRASINSYIRKSSTADATAREWIMIADEKTFYLMIFQNGYGPGVDSPSFITAFGDYEPLDGDTTYNCFLAARSGVPANNSNWGASNGEFQLLSHGGATCPLRPPANDTGSFGLGSRSALDGVADRGALAMTYGSSSSPIGGGQPNNTPLGPYPALGINQGLWSNLLIVSTTAGETVIRGRLRGVLMPQGWVSGNNATPTLLDFDSVAVDGESVASNWKFFRSYAGAGSAVASNRAYLGGCLIQTGEEWNG